MSTFMDFPFRIDGSGRVGTTDADDDGIWVRKFFRERLIVPAYICGSAV